MNPTDILIVIFIIIFSATAILTICALPGWIKIPDTYLKILFSSLILEVIAFVFVMVNKGNEHKHDCKENHWVVLNEKGNISTLSIDSIVISSNLDNFSSEARKHAKFNLVKEECDDGLKYFIKKDSFYIGRLYDNTLSNLNLFDTMDLKETTFESIKYVKNNNGQWIIEGWTLPKEWSLKISVSGSTYTISDTNTRICNVSVSGFDNIKKGEGRRKLHSFKGSDGAFYLVHISGADNSSTDKQHFVRFNIIRTSVDTKLH